ncbi:MAG: DNA gyrase subunit A [Gemmatimonadota bacterium]|nr:DNA gyrase subunit A [Gemmatimonadota bacterium]MDE2870387.1 DNA gyrase subunit A [Gemmatimonadota bacterium]
MTVSRMRDRIVPRLIEEEMRESFIDYSMSVIVRRALPDVRDGLKPVHRRILVAMHGLGLHPDRNYKKSASVVGEVLGKYHPHGDAAVYDALVRMVQDFSLRYPLVAGQGNFGSIDGDPAAAYRYTEARLAPVATELLAEIAKDTVEWENNFDDRLQEPAVLPSRIPNLLVNGSSGIAVGMSTNVPPHNLVEVAAALRRLVADPGCGTEELMEVLPGPDFPTGGYIVGREGIESMYRTGRGRMTMRARVVTEAVRGGRMQLVVTELPYAVSKSRIIAQIAGLSRKGALPDVADLRDESDREGIRLVLELKRGTDAGRIMAKLFRKTALQCTFGAILLALDGGRQPTEFTLAELLSRYRDHRLQVIRRRSRFDLEKAETDLHITEGLLLALAHIDEVIGVIRGSADRARAAERLRDRFGLSDVQTDAILRMRLSRLTALEGDQLRAREGSLRASIRELRALLADEALQLEVMLEELDEVVERYGDARRTEILEGKDKTGFAYVETGIADEDVVVTRSRQGYLKRIPMHLYRRRLAAGLSLAAMERYGGDYLESVVVARTRGWILSFTTSGRVYFLRVEDVPEGSRASRGKSLWALLGIDRRNPIVATRTIDDLEEDRYLAFATRLGLVKRTRLAEFANPRAGALIASGIRAGDALLDVASTSGDAELLLVTRGGRAIRFPEPEVSVVGRTARGVKGVGLREDDEVIAFIVALREASVMLVTEGGTGKRTPMAEFPVQRRGGLGMRAMPARERGGHLVGALEALDDDKVVLVSAAGAVTGVAAAEIALRHRTAPGHPIVKPGPGDRIVDVTRLYGEAPASGGRDLLSPA